MSGLEKTEKTKFLNSDHSEAIKLISIEIY